MSTATAERVYYDAGGVTVTSSRVVISGTTYALRNIVSVALVEIPTDRLAELLMLSVGGIITLFGVGTAIGQATSFSNDASVVMPVFAAVAGAGLFMWGLGAMRKKTPRYAVQISSSSGESNALTHRDMAYVQRIVAAVAQAIGDRG